MIELKDRIINLLKYTGLSIPKFAAAIGAKSPQSIREILKGNTKTLSGNMQSNILSYLPELNTVWLLAGEGEMLKPITTLSTSGNESPIVLGDGSAGRDINQGGRGERVVNDNIDSQLRDLTDPNEQVDNHEIDTHATIATACELDKIFAELAAQRALTERAMAHTDKVQAQMDVILEMLKSKM